MAAPVLVGSMLVQQRVANNANPQLVITPPTAGGTAIQDGDMMVIVMAAQAVTATAPQLINAGWTVIGTQVQANSFHLEAKAKVRLAGETSYTFTGSGSTSLSSQTIRLMWFRGASADVADIVWTGITARAASSAISLSPSITTTSADNLVVAIGGDRRPAAPYVGLASVNNGFTNVIYDLEADLTNGTTAGSGQLAVSTKVQTVAGAVGDTSHTFNGTAGTSGAGGTFALKPLASASPTSLFGFVSDFTKTSLRVGAKIVNATKVRLVATPSAGGAAITSADATPSASGWTTVNVTGLANGTDYDLSLQAGDSYVEVRAFQNIRTLTDVPEAFKVISGSCQGHTSGYAVTAYNQMATENAQFFTHQGDLHYADATTESAWRAAVESSLTKTPMNNFLKTTPMTWHWDNHDWGGNESFKDSPPKDFAPAAVRELTSASIYPDPVGVYGQWAHAGVRFIETDQWALRDEAAAANAYTNQLIASDDFSRVAPTGDLTVGWTATSSGERWKTDGSSSKQPEYANGKGVNVLVANQKIFTKLDDITGSSFDATIKASFDKLPVVGNVYAGITRHSTGAVNPYYGYILVSPAGNVTARIMVGGTQLATASLGTYTPGDVWNLHFKVAGLSPTALQFSAWKVGTAEPGTWQMDVTDSTADLQTAGTIGVYGATTGITNTPITISFDDFSVTGTATSASTDFKVGKSLFGAAQRAWLLDALSRAKEGLIIWFCSFPLYGNWTGNGRWGDFREEADFMWKWLNARPWIKRRIVCIGGDSHNVAADDGTNTMWNLPSLNASPIDRTGETGGVMSTTWNLANVAVDVSVGAYSRLTFTPITGGTRFRWDAVDGTGALVGLPFQRDYPLHPDYHVGAVKASKVFIGGTQVWATTSIAAPGNTGTIFGNTVLTDYINGTSYYNDSNPITVFNEFYRASGPDLWITHLRYYVLPGGPMVGKAASLMVWDPAMVSLAGNPNFVGVALSGYSQKSDITLAAGWNEVALATPIKMPADSSPTKKVQLGVYVQNGNYMATGYMGSNIVTATIGSSLVAYSEGNSGGTAVPQSSGYFRYGTPSETTTNSGNTFAFWTGLDIKVTDADPS